MLSTPLSLSNGMARASRLGRVRGVLGAACVAAALSLAGTAVQAASFTGLTGEVWFKVDLYSGLAAEDRIKENILPRAEDAMRSRPADGTFVATGLDYPQGADTVVSSGTGAASVADFLSSDHASFALRDGVSEPATWPLSNSLWRFTGFVLLDPHTSYEFRIRSDDGNASWMGFDPDLYPEWPHVDSNNFRASGTFDNNNPEGFCCSYNFSTGVDGKIPFKMIFYERYGNTGLRMRFSTDGGASFTTLQGGDMLARDGAIPSAIPLPAAGWMLLATLGGLSAVGWRRRA